MSFSKQLTQDDSSGSIFTSRIFPSPLFQPLLLNFERIQEDCRNNSLVFIEHILVKEPVNHLDELPDNIIYKINKLISFSNLLSQKTNHNKTINLIIDLYFPIDSLYKDTILLLNHDLSFSATTITDFAFKFQEINFYGNSFNKDVIFNNYIPSPTDRVENTPFALTKYLLNKYVTYGFNIDQIIYNEKSQEIYLFEYLLCESSQTVTPYESHPNRYFSNNSQKFITLFKFSSQFHLPLYLLNYAKPYTTHQDKILFMKVLNVDPLNLNKNFVQTKNKETNITSLITQLEKKFLITNPILKIGF